MLVITKVVYFIATRLGAEAEVWFLGDLATGTVHVEQVHAADWLRIAELVGRYSDLPLGTVDASLVAVCERRGVADVATLDRRDFAVIRPQGLPRLTLLPDLN